MTDDVEYGQYRQRLTDWEHERERQKQEFVITENDLDADMRLDSPEITVSYTERRQTMGKVTELIFLYFKLDRVAKLKFPTFPQFKSVANCSGQP